MSITCWTTEEASSPKHDIIISYVFRPAASKYIVFNDRGVPCESSIFKSNYLNDI